MHAFIRKTHTAPGLPHRISKPPVSFETEKNWMTGKSFRYSKTKLFHFIRSHIIDK